MRRLAIAFLVAGAALGLGSGPRAVASPAPSEGSDAAAAALPPVDVFEVSGLLDTIVAEEIAKAIDNAAEDGSQALILQLNSRRAVISDDDMVALIAKIRASKVPVAVWVGPSGARAYGRPGQLVGAVSIAGMAPGTRIGNFGTTLEADGAPLDFGTAASTLATDTLGYDEARAAGVLRLPNDAPDALVIRDMLRALDGLKYSGGELDTVIETAAADGTIESSSTAPRFFKLGLVPRLFHTVASPPVAYLLFVIGVALLIFEFFTAGVGVAGVVGVTCFVLGCYGFGVLPMRGWALGLLIASLVALSIDVQVGVPRFWTGAGILAFTFASVVLYRDGIRMSWVTLITGIGGIALTFVVGMPSMVRTRFATPTIGREWLVGKLGTAVAEISPEGVVRVEGATWRARTNRSTPIPAGDQVRIAAIDGITLEVEPLEGAARDYRERRGSSPEAGGSADHDGGQPAADVHQ